jgi:hypothetical protein
MWGTRMPFLDAFDASISMSEIFKPLLVIEYGVLVLERLAKVLLEC